MSLMHSALRTVSAASLLCAAGMAQASGPLSFQKIIMYSDAVPGVPGAAWETGASSSIYSTPVVFDDGTVAFQGRIATGGDITTSNRIGVWAGAPGATAIVARDGQTGPSLGNPNGWGHNGFLGTGAGLNFGVSGTQSGVLLLSSNLGSTSNSGSASNNSNTAFWTGAPTTAGMNLVAQGGGVSPAVAPGTGNSIFSSTLRLNLNLTKVNSAGQAYFASNLVAGSGGDSGLITGTWSEANPTNDSAIWLAKPGAGNMTMVAREGQSTTLPQVSGANPILGDIATTIQNPQLNSSGMQVFSQRLRTGFAGVTNASGSANDDVLWATPGGVLTPIARKNDPVPGVAGKVYNNTGSLGFSTSSQSLNNDGRILFGAQFAGGGDAMMTWKSGENGSVAHPIVQPGDAAPGITGNTFTTFGGTNPNFRLNNNNYVAFAATATDGSTTTGGVWGGFLNAGGEFGTAPSLLVSQGMAAPGMDPGVTFDSGFFGVIMNNLNQVVFTAKLVGTGVTTNNDSVLCAYDPAAGLMIVLREGVDNGASLGIPGFGTLSGFSVGGSGTGDGGSQAFSDTGWLAFSANETANAGNGLLAVTRIPAPGAAALLGLAGLVGSRRRRA